MKNGQQYSEMTDAQREHFDQYGYLVIEDALPPPVVGELNEAIDEVYDRARKEGTLGKKRRSEHAELHRDPRRFSATARLAGDRSPGLGRAQLEHPDDHLPAHCPAYGGGAFG